MTPKVKLFWPVALAVTLADCGTKQLAEEWLHPEHPPRQVFGNAVRFTLAYNPGAAMGVEVDPLSRWSLVFLALAALCMVLWMYVRASIADRWQIFALALISGGAVGNVIDRLRSHRGVVDFIDVGIDSYRFYTFNVADTAVTLGAVILLALFWTRAWRGNNPTTK